MDNEVSKGTTIQIQILNTELGGKSLDVLGIEIQEYDNLAGKCFEEVCKRYWYIKNVTFKDDTKGWRTWRDAQNRSKQYINKCIQIYQQHLDSQSGKSTFYLGYEKSSQLVSLESVIVEEVLNNHHEMGGKEKTVEEMTVKELEKVIEEVKKKHQQELKEEREAKETVIKNNEDLQKQIKRERKHIPETIQKSVRVRSGNRCERCGYDFNKFPIEVFHHINVNPSDNRLDNILHMCPNCHALEHYILRGGKLNG